jgi:MYXO-CTERM domain-containing protein
MRALTSLAVAAVAIAASPAWAGYTITQGSSAPTYTDRTLNFDEPGTPTGVVPTDTWSVSHGITEMQAGDGVPQVDLWDSSPAGGWGLGDANSFFGNFGVFMTFDHDITAMSLEVWDPSGPPSPFGGGLIVFLFNDGVEVGNGAGTPAWGGVGDSWWDIVGTGGDVFDEVRILGFGFSPTTYVDNLSWNMSATPGPGTLALLAMAGLASRRRRRD